MSTSDSPNRVSRGDAETVILLRALEEGGSIDAITERLGLAAGLAPAVKVALERLTARGLVGVTAEHQMTLSEMGRAFLGQMEDGSE